MSDEIREINSESRLQAVDQKAAILALAEDRCERGYAQLGWMLLEVAQLHLWRVNHTTFRDYLRRVAMVSKKTAETLQRYILTVRDLSDTFSCAQLEEMGISKAMKLRQAKDYAIVLPKVLVDAALDSRTSVKELHKLISITLRLPEDEGDWFDLSAEFYVNAEERATIEDAISAAEHCDPVTKRNISSSMQRKDIVLKWAMEFLASHSPDGGC